MRFPKLILAGGLLVVLAIYSMGWSGTLHFDDEPNLDGLSGISDFASGLRFVFSGESGPTGRPLSLATFALQHESWPDSRPFLIFNSVLHILNGVLCFLLLRRLLGWMHEDRRAAEWLAVIVTLVWAASPFLASSTLVVVQRMTGLSAFFVVLALNIYTIARSGYRPDSWRSNLWLALIAGVGTVLAGFAKENGFLLPVFLVLIEWLLVGNARITIRPLHKVFFWVVLMTPVGLILGFLLKRGLSAGGYLYRDFTQFERLLTQPRAVFDYIRNLLIPSTEFITPFHDAYAYSTGLFNPATTIFAIAGLVMLVGLAWALRRRWPIVAFGILFFLGGHLIESTVIPLELYFPHRNYLPAIGLYLAIAYPFFVLAGRHATWRKPAAATAAVYLLLFCGVLGYGTSLWGNRMLSAEVWYVHNQGSVRAVRYLYRYYSGEDEVDVASSINRLAIRNHPGDARFTIQSLAICDDTEDNFESKVERAVRDLENEDAITVNNTSIIQNIAALATRSDCEHLNIERAERLIDAAMSRDDRLVHPKALQNLLMSRAQLADQRGDYKGALQALEEVMAVEPMLHAALMIAFYHVESGDPRAAINHLQKLVDSPPVGFPESIVWKNRLGELLKNLRSLENSKTDK